MSLSSAERTQAALARIPAQQSLTATFVSQTGAVAVVNQGNTQLQVKSAASGIVAGDPVRLERRRGDLVLIGPVAARAKIGRVTATGTPTTVEYPNGSGVTAQLRRNNAYTPAVNDIVLIDWGTDGGVIVGKLDAAPSTTPPAAPGTAPVKAYDVTFRALDSGAYQSGYGWRTNDVWSSASNIGAWFYGSKIRDTIPDAATITSAQIFLPLRSRLGAAPFGRHGNDTKPAGAVTFSATSTLTSLDGWVSIPTSLLDHLKANPGGLGFDLGGLNIWDGTQLDKYSGALRVKYKA